MSTLVNGGTGTLGREVVSRLVGARVLSRRGPLPVAATRTVRAGRDDPAGRGDDMGGPEDQDGAVTLSVGRPWAR
ncbi:hypothetical protein [Amycolatopsis sp. NPDC059657]|uniref:hypothetical protein n=1 Tax=Amycolatopsis sp. NPDC059657 TaxID=3346899 RepID=UPI00366B7BF0